MLISMIGLIIIVVAFVYRSMEKTQKETLQDTCLLNTPSASPVCRQETDYAIDMDDIEFL